MGNVYILLGSTRVRKSASIRALTGFARNSRNNLRPISVKLENGDVIKVCVFSQSPQEANISVQKFAQKVANIGPDWNILIALQIDERAVEYIRAIPESNRHSIYIALLGMTEIPENIQRQFVESELDINILRPGIENSANMPANEIAHIIRERWNWL